MLSFVIFLFSYLSSCVEQKSWPLHIVIDLKENTESIRYSQFAQSVDYIELNTNDSCIISDISKIFLDEDTLIEYITPNVPLVSLTNVPDISLLNVPLFTGCN